MDSTRPKDGVAVRHAEAFARGLGRDKSDAFTGELWRGVLAVVTGARAFARFVRQIPLAKAAYRCDSDAALVYGALAVLNELAEDQTLASGLTARRAAHVLVASICAFPLRNLEPSIRRIQARCARSAFSDLNQFVAGMVAVADLDTPAETLREALVQAGGVRAGIPRWPKTSKACQHVLDVLAENGGEYVSRSGFGDECPSASAHRSTLKGRWGWTEEYLKSAEKGSDMQGYMLTAEGLRVYRLVRPSPT